MKQEPSLTNNVKAIRDRLGMSQQQLADAAGVTRQTIGNIEHGPFTPSAIVALRLAKTLGCRVEDLFWLEEDLPTVEATCAGNTTSTSGDRLRVSLARVGERWVAHP